MLNCLLLRLPWRQLRPRIQPTPKRLRELGVVRSLVPGRMESNSRSCPGVRLGLSESIESFILEMDCGREEPRCLLPQSINQQAQSHPQTKASILSRDWKQALSVNNKQCFRTVKLFF